MAIEEEHIRELVALIAGEQDPNRAREFAQELNDLLEARKRWREGNLLTKQKAS